MVTNISPLVQSEVLSVLRYALGEEIADELCGPSHGSEYRQLEMLQGKMEEAALSVKRESVRFIADQLKEFANLSLQMAYILRHELRPCLNLLNMHHWVDGRRAALVERSCALLATSTENDAQTDKKWLEEYAKKSLPGTGDSVSSHCEFLNNLAYCVCSLLDTLVSSNEGQLAELVEDYIEEACQTLATQTPCRAGWKWGLRHYKHILLREQYAELQRRSADRAAYSEMMKELETVI